MMNVHGHVDAGLEPVAETFRELFAAGREIGASFCVWREGRNIVDLWGGIADLKSGRLWTPDTMVNVFSSTKGMAATAVLMASERDLIDYDEPVAKRWPQFAHNGKDAITLRQIMNHRSGLSAIDQPLVAADFADPERVRPALEAQAPLWPPGSAQGYGAIAYGPFVAEIFRRATGETLGAFIDREIAKPLEADIYLGVPDGIADRIATLYPIGPADFLTKVIPRLVFSRGLEGRMYRAALRRQTPTARAVRNPAELGSRGMHRYNDPDVRSMELPWANGHASARGLAKMYGHLASGGSYGGVTLCRPQTVAAVHPRQSWTDHDRVLQKPMGFSQGYVKEETHLFSPNPASFGHPGAGGALGFADPIHGIGMSYVLNRMDFHIRSPRCIALCHALYRCIGRGALDV